ncbi:MAG TPA: AMP-binding protein [Novosphingobium sp.]
MSSVSNRTMFRFGYGLPEMTIPHVLADMAARHGDKVFLTAMADGRRFTYRDIDLLSNRIANRLLALGLGRGSHVAVMMENCPEQVLLYFAIGKIGGVAVPFNTAARGKLIEYFLTQSDSVAVVCEAEFTPFLATALPAAPAIRTMIVLGEGDCPALPEGVAVGSFAALLEGGSDAPPGVPVRFDDLAMLLYTSGTTGPSKGNMMVQATVVQFGMTTAESHGYHSTDVLYICLPLNHLTGYVCALWGALIAGGSVAMSRRFSASRYWSEVRASGATMTNLMGSMAHILWTQEPRPDDRDNRLRGCLMTPVPAFAREWQERFGSRVLSSYGQSDFISASVYSLADPEAKLGSSGRPRAGVELRIVDDNDEELPAGTVGELVIRTNNPWSSSQGYYKMPQATLEAGRNQWWHTGDLAHLDEDGYLWFADRKKDAIRRRGENISAYEVEDVIIGHPAVSEVAVYAVPSEMSEDEVCATVVRKPDAALTEAALIEYCIVNMAHYMVPRFIHFADALPRTETQKVQKVELRRFATEHREALWDRDVAGIVVKR